MSATSGRERVVQPYDPRGVLCVAMLWGGFVGTVVIPALEQLNGWLVPRAPMWAGVAGLGLMIVPYGVIPLLLARVSRRLKFFVLAAIVMNFGAFAAAFVQGFVQDPGFGVNWWRTSLNAQMPIAFAFTTAIAVATASLMRWLFQTLRYKPIEQTTPPRLCLRCAYEMGCADPCPECGTSRKDSRPRGAWLDSVWRLVQRRSRPVLVVLLLAFTGYAGWRIVTDFLPTRNFQRRFGEGGNDAYAYIDARIPENGSYVPSSGRTFELNDGTGRMILVSFNSRPPKDLPMMQVRICASATLPAGWPAGAQRMTDWGLPNTVVADLNRVQAERVIRDGLPRGLVDAIVAKADEIGWKPGGGMQNVGGARRVIDPAPYFTQAVAGPPAIAPVQPPDNP